jgi:hypothetical protein
MNLIRLFSHEEASLAFDHGQFYRKKLMVFSATFSERKQSKTSMEISPITK